MSNYFLDGDFRFSQSVTFNPVSSNPIGSYWTTSGANPGGVRGTYNGQTYSSKGWLAVGPAIPDPAIRGVCSVGLIGSSDYPSGNFGAMLSTKIPNGNRIFSGTTLRISFWLYTNARHVGLRLHRNFGTSSATTEQVIDMRVGQDAPVGVWEHVTRDFKIPGVKSSDDFRPDDFITLDVVVDNIGVSAPFLSIQVPFAETTGVAVPLLAVTGFYADSATSQTPAVPVFYTPAPATDAGQLTGSVGGSGFTIAGTGLNSSGGGTTIGLTTPVAPANGGTGVTTATAEGTRVAFFPLSTEWPNTAGGADVPSFSGQIGITAQGAVFKSTGISAGNWGNLQVNLPGGVVQIGDTSGMGVNAAFSNVFWYFGGTPSQQTSTSGNGDKQLILVNTNPYGSGSGVSCALVGKTNPGGSPVSWVNSNSETIYLQDKYAVSLLITPENGPALDNPKVGSIVINAVHPFSICNTFNPTGTQANYPWYYTDPRTSPYKSYFSKFVDTKIDPTTSGWLSTMVIDHTNGTVSLFGSCVNTGFFRGSSLVTSQTNASGFLKTSGVSALSLDLGNSNGSGISYDVTPTAGIGCLTTAYGGHATHVETIPSQGWFPGGGTPQTSPIFVIGNETNLSNGNNWGNSTLEVQGSTATDVKTKSSAYTLTIDDSVVNVTGTTTITLPDATFHAKGRIYTVKNTGTNIVTVATTSSQTIDGVTTATLEPNQFIRVQCDTTNWQVVAGSAQLSTVTAQHFAGRGTAPGIAAGTGAGTSPTISLDATASDSAGVISVTAGTAPAAASVVVTITFNKAYNTVPHVIFSPANSAASSASTDIFTTATTTTFTLTTGATALVATTVYKWTYQVVE